MPRQRREFKIYNENIDRTFTQHQTKIEQLDNSITLQATSITTVSGRVDTLDGNVSTLSGDVSTLDGNVSTLSGNVNTLSGDVSDLSDDLSDLDTQVQTNEARMIIESNGILSTVTSAIGADTVISTVNQTAGQYIIDSNKIDLRGVVTFSDLSTNGNTTITGNNITTGIIKDTNSNTTFDLSTGALTIGSGSINLGNNFSVTSSGVCTIKSGSITLGSTSGSYFNVTSSGAMTAYNATIKGTLTSQNGNYNTTVSNGFVNFYIGSTYVGKVGGSTFYDRESGFDYYGSMLDVGLDAKYGGIAVQENSGEAAKLALYYDRNSNAFLVRKKTYFTSFIDATGRIYTDDGFTGGTYLYVSNSSGTVGINHDQYGVALYNNSSNNNYIRVGADRVDVAVSGGFYVNGTRLA